MGYQGRAHGAEMQRFGNQRQPTTTEGRTGQRRPCLGASSDSPVGCELRPYSKCAVPSRRAAVLLAGSVASRLKTETSKSVGIIVNVMSDLTRPTLDNPPTGHERFEDLLGNPQDRR